MGGAKKRSLSQIERQQRLAARRKARLASKRSPKSRASEKKVGGIVVQDIGSEELVGEFAKMGAITPYAVASRFGLRMSIAKNLLEDLERRRTIKEVVGNNRIKVYALVEG
ncbi:MAG: hypothetical protein ACE5Z5_07150 [Candidatus Bathyarchaeia archaeon]